jgi:hypothetical protein
MDDLRSAVLCGCPYCKPLVIGDMDPGAVGLVTLRYQEASGPLDVVRLSMTAVPDAVSSVPPLSVMCRFSMRVSVGSLVIA